MSQHNIVTTNGLANLINALLLRPSEIGHLDDLNTHSRFKNELAELVANYVGGQVAGTMADGDQQGAIVIMKNESSPEEGDAWCWAEAHNDARWHVLQGRKMFDDDDTVTVHFGTCESAEQMFNEDLGVVENHQKKFDEESDYLCERSREPVDVATIAKTTI